MLVASLDIFLAIVPLLTEDLLTLLARPATNVARQDILAEIALKRLPTVILLLTLSISALLLLSLRSHQLHRSTSGHHIR